MPKKGTGAGAILMNYGNSNDTEANAALVPSSDNTFPVFTLPTAQNALTHCQSDDNCRKTIDPEETTLDNCQNNRRINAILKKLLFMITKSAR